MTRSLTYFTTSAIIYEQSLDVFKLERSHYSYNIFEDRSCDILSWLKGTKSKNKRKVQMVLDLIIILSTAMHILSGMLQCSFHSLLAFKRRLNQEPLQRQTLSSSQRRNGNNCNILRTSLTVYNKGLIADNGSRYLDGLFVHVLCREPLKICELLKLFLFYFIYKAVFWFLAIVSMNTNCIKGFYR